MDYLTNLDILPVEKYHELRSKWQNKETFEYKFQNGSFRFCIRGVKGYHFTPGDNMDFLISFDISEKLSGTGWAEPYSKEELQEYDSLFKFIEPRIKQYCPDYQFVSEYQLSLFYEENNEINRF